jgi:hypothetical protein
VQDDRGGSPLLIACFALLRPEVFEQHAHDVAAVRGGVHGRDRKSPRGERGQYAVLGIEGGLGVLEHHGRPAAQADPFDA